MRKAPYQTSFSVEDQILTVNLCQNRDAKQGFAAIVRELFFVRGKRVSQRLRAYRACVKSDAAAAGGGYGEEHVLPELGDFQHDLPERGMLVSLRGQLVVHGYSYSADELLEDWVGAV